MMNDLSTTVIQSDQRQLLEITGKQLQLRNFDYEYCCLLKIIMNLTKNHTTLLEIPVTIRIIGDPVLVANKIFDGKENPKTGEYIIPKSILIENEIECRFKDYEYKHEVGAPQNLLIVFGVIGEISKSSSISDFLFEKLKDFRKTTIVINKQELKIMRDVIYKSLEEMRNNFL